MANRNHALMLTRSIPLCLLLIAAGCGNNSTATPTSCADNPAGCLCSGDEMCGGANPRCDFHTGRCVPCLPESNNCGSGMLCVRDGSNYRCAMGCLATSDCPVNGAVQLQCCGGACVDVGTSAGNCGACGVVCGDLPNARNSCVGGGCVITSCATGYGDCDGNANNGCETSVATSPNNCGTCGTHCNAGQNATPTCNAGTCAAACVQGFADCDGNTVNGCEIDTATNPANCGACGSRCGPLPNATSVGCAAGHCVAAACNGWYGDCDGNAANGCESDTQSDVKNCGGCGLACPAALNGEVACVAGVCTLAKCNSGYGDCDGNTKNGCEMPTFNDPLNCGSCGTVCTGANGAQDCSNGSCVVSLCNQGFADCDGNAKNGCESNILAEVKNCGACGNLCVPPANAISACTQGACRPAGCQPGFANCNDDWADGCETDITTITDCGACAVRCAVPANGTPRCLAGTCTIGVCNGGFANCDNETVNGCERNLNTDPQACGACGITCSYDHAAPLCNAGKCAMGACDAGRADCNKDDKDGCELPVASDPKNCGGCGVVCGVNEPYCVKGQCTASTHAVEQLAWDYQTFSDGCGNYSVWYTLDVGTLTWDDCEAAANKYGAMMMGETGWFGGYGAPYQWDVRWVGESDADNGWVSTGGWDTVEPQSKGAQNKCILAYANGTEHGNSTLPNTITSLNGKTYQYDDLGVIGESDCYNKAREAGARPLNPWMFNGVNQDTAFMVESHICHGSTMYNGLGGYSSDGGTDHYYRCLIGYNP